MNYLAHLHLGGHRPAQLLGSLYGDFVKGPLPGRFPAELEAAIRLHRSIDAFTDSHPLIKASIARFPLQRRRYAGIMLDVFSIIAWRATGIVMPTCRWTHSPAKSMARWLPSRNCPSGWR